MGERPTRTQRLNEARRFARDCFEWFNQNPTPEQIERVAEKITAQFDFLDRPQPKDTDHGS